MPRNKVIYGDEVLIDLTGDTVTPDTLAEGVTAHDAAGNPITGTMAAAKPEQTKTATPSLSQQTISPDSGKVLSGVTVEPITSTLLTSLDSDFKAENIAEGVNMFGVAGTHAGGAAVETCTVTITDADGSMSAVDYTGVIDKDLSYNALGSYPAYGTPLVITVVKNTVFIVHHDRFSSASATAGIENAFSEATIAGYLCTGNGSLAYGGTDV